MLITSESPYLLSQSPFPSFPNYTGCCKCWVIWGILCVGQRSQRWSSATFLFNQSWDLLYGGGVGNLDVFTCWLVSLPLYKCLTSPIIWLRWFEHRIKPWKPWNHGQKQLSWSNLCVIVCFRDVDQATSPSWIPSPQECGSLCFWPTWLSAVFSFWWLGKAHTNKILSVREGQKKMVLTRGREQRVKT